MVFPVPVMREVVFLAQPDDVEGPVVVLMVHVFAGSAATDARATFDQPTAEVGASVGTGIVSAALLDGEWMRRSPCPLGFRVAGMAAALRPPQVRGIAPAAGWGETFHGDVFHGDTIPGSATWPGTSPWPGRSMPVRPR